MPEHSCTAPGLSKNIGECRGVETDGYAPIILNTDTSRFSSSTSFPRPGRIARIKHEQHNIGLVGILAQHANAACFHLAAPDRGLPRYGIHSEQGGGRYTGDKSISSDVIITSSCRGSRGGDWAERITAVAWSASKTDGDGRKTYGHLRYGLCDEACAPRLDPIVRLAALFCATKIESIPHMRPNDVLDHLSSSDVNSQF
ncbi:hypothetical protein EDB83DRAFT_2610917 [Lactarius deliciosus]|nr:hypothetical protein EDB83DRAFT_2610917 [Lactarius deliciosus]